MPQFSRRVMATGELAQVTGDTKYDRFAKVVMAEPTGAVPGRSQPRWLKLIGD
jgi:hypothetical protein